MRVLVCGGRDYENYETLSTILSILTVSEIIQGGAKGADFLARKWALDNCIPVFTYEADWKNEGKSAGIKRNIRMLDESKPDFVLAFPGGRGTEHMKTYARSKGYFVLEVK